MSRYMYICIRYCEVFGYLHLLAWGEMGWQYSHQWKDCVKGECTGKVNTTLPIMHSDLSINIKCSLRCPILHKNASFMNHKMGCPVGAFRMLICTFSRRGMDSCIRCESVWILHPDLQRPASLLSAFGHYHLGSTQRARLPHGRHFCQY